MEAIKSIVAWFKKPIQKNFVLALLTIVSTYLVSYYFSIPQNERPFWIFLVFIVITVVYLICLAEYSKDEINKNTILGIYAKQNKALQMAIHTMRRYLTYDANHLLAAAYDIENRGEINLRDVTFCDCCKDLCKYVFDAVSVLDDENNFEVTYVKRIDDDHVCTVGFYNRDNTHPKVLNKVRPIYDDNSYYDAKQFRKDGNMNIQAFSKTDINSSFVKTSESVSKYTQYISVPVCCTDTHMIGLLQVVAISNSKFAITVDQVRFIADHVINPFAYMFYQKIKSERVIFAKVQKKI